MTGEQGGVALDLVLPVLHSAALVAASEIVARSKDGSFLEKTLRDALAAHLPRASIEQRLHLDPVRWPGRLGGVDVLYVDADARVGVETKVWGVADSLYDVFKLAAGVQAGKLDAGFCVIAGRSRDWRAPTAILAMSASPASSPVEWETAVLLEDHAREWVSIWSRTAIKPLELPARLRTTAGPAIPMPLAPDHEIRIIGVQSVGTGCLRLDLHGAIVVQ